MTLSLIACTYFLLYGAILRMVCHTIMVIIAFIGSIQMYIPHFYVFYVEIFSNQI